MNVLIAYDDVPNEIFSFSQENVKKAEKLFLDKIKENINSSYSENNLEDFLENGYCGIDDNGYCENEDDFVFEIYLIHSF